MFKYVVVIFTIIACAAAKPHLLTAVPLAYAAAPAAVFSAAPAPFVTATSHQFIARNYNGIAHAPIVATAPIAHLDVAPAFAPLAAYSTHYAAPLHYTAAAPLAW